MIAPDGLPTAKQALERWLGFQLPSIPLPQTMKNADKAIGKLLLALVDNLEARLRRNTDKANAMGTIEVEEIFHTAEEKRKFENRAATTRAAMDELCENSANEDANAEIEDDWLNVFARLTEDKSSAELQRLFGRILAGEIRRPGTFSLRTMQILAALSKSEADSVSRFLSFGLDGMIVPFRESDSDLPLWSERFLMEELGVAGHPSKVGSASLIIKIPPSSTQFLRGIAQGILIDNKSSKALETRLLGQTLGQAARELIVVAGSPPTDPEYLKEVAKQLLDDLKSRHSDMLELGEVVISPSYS